MLDWHSKSSLLWALTLTDDTGGYIQRASCLFDNYNYYDNNNCASQQIRIGSQRVASHRIALLTLTGQAAGRRRGRMSCTSCCVAPKRRGSMSYKEQTAFGKGKGCHIEYMPGPVVRLPRVARDDKCSRGDDEEEKEKKMKTRKNEDDTWPDVVWVNNLRDVCR